MSQKKYRPKEKSRNNLLITAIFVLVVVTSLISFFSKKTDYSKINNVNDFLKEPNQETNSLESVVQIICDDQSAGSGLMISNDGFILTNYHVVSDAEWCLVTIPDEGTGEPKEIYYSSPLIVSELSKLYDIAMLIVDDVYTDEDGYSWGSYPNTFKYFQQPESCKDDSKLGDSIKIYGYPSTSNNYNLTITEGIISNFDGDYILTSAKIDTGNSGGLAVDNNSCWVGIPSAILEGDYQNLGVIIPTNIIKEFVDEVNKKNLN